MKKPNHVEDSAQLSSKSTPDLTAEQRDALANVYRLLLSVHDKKTNEDASKNPTSPESPPHADGFLQPTAEPSDK